MKSFQGAKHSLMKSKQLTGTFRARMFSQALTDNLGLLCNTSAVASQYSCVVRSNSTDPFRWNSGALFLSSPRLSTSVSIQHTSICLLIKMPWKHFVTTVAEKGCWCNHNNNFLSHLCYSTTHWAMNSSVQLKSESPFENSLFFPQCL